MYKNSALPSRPGMQSTSQHAQRRIVSVTFAIVVFALASTTLACADDSLASRPLSLYESLRERIRYVMNSAEKTVWMITGGMSNGGYVDAVMNCTISCNTW